MIAVLLALRIASYAAQASSGAPLLRGGVIDTAAVRQLAYFDIVTLEATPWAQGTDGNPRLDVPVYLRRLNPLIKLYLYVLAGDQWLPESFVPGGWDHSGFRDAFDAVKASHGFLYGTDGLPWFPNYRVDLGNARCAENLTFVYQRLISTHLFDGIFLDDCHTSIAWTARGSRSLDYARAGYRSLESMDSARAVNVARMVARLHEAGGCGFMVALNGTGPRPAGLDIDFREGLGSLISVADAEAWMRTPGTHWLKSEQSGPATARLLKDIALNGDAIISCGPDRLWPPYPISRLP